MRCHRPAHHHPCREIDHDREVQPTRPRLEVGNIPDEFCARYGRIKVTVAVSIEHVILDMRGPRRWVTRGGLLPCPHPNRFQALFPHDRPDRTLRY